jgi:hypothetical protein
MAGSAAVHPAPMTTPPGSSVEVWLWLALIVALVLATGLVLASRR